LTTVGTYLHDQGYEVTIYDGDRPAPNCKSYSRDGANQNYPRYLTVLKDRSNPVWKEIMDLVADIKPDAVGMKSMLL
jgi:hypothetical protein